jgi:hypothetical protein
MAWQKAFSALNINSAFKATSLKPWDPQQILATFQRPALPPSPSFMAFRTSKSLRTLRQQIKALQKTHGVDSPTAHIIRAAEIFATENEILRHENNRLRNAIKEEKKRRKRGKPLELMDEDDIPGQGLIFSPAKIERARQRIRQREEIEQREKQSKADQRLQQAIIRSER